MCVNFEVDHMGKSETIVFVRTLKWTHKPTLNTKQTTTTTRTSLLLRMRKMRQSVLVLTPKYAEYYDYYYTNTAAEQP